MVELSLANKKLWLSLVESVSHLPDSEFKDELASLLCSTQTAATRQHQTRLTGEQIASLIDGYLAGSTVYQLADQFGCHRKTVSDHLKRASVKMRRTPLSTDQIERASELYGSGHSCASIAQLFGVDSNTVRLRLIEVGVRMRDSHGKERTTDAT